MNFYLLSVFVILCFGPWTIAREVYQRLAKNSVEVTEDATKKLNADAASRLINGLVQAASRTKTWIQRLRRLLKALRKWCSSHPHEVKLGKCFASHFDVKIPGSRQGGKTTRNNENRKETELPSRTSKRFSFGRAAPWPGQRRASGDNFLEKSVLFFYFRNFVLEFIGHLRHYRDAIFKNNLMTCVWDYFWKKFWIWIDSTPDSRCNF